MDQEIKMPMLRLKSNSMKLPIGGHHFVERSITFKAESFEDLAEKVRDFRLNNSIPIGDVENDILLYYANNWPWLVEEDPEQVSVKKNDLYDKWRDWAFGAKKRPIRKFVTDKEMALRYETCKECPYRVTIKPKHRDEYDAIMRKIFAYARGSMVCESNQFCRLHSVGIPVLLAADSPKEVLPMKDGQSHPKCWIK
jgi:DNA-directed RNA polymerase subunit RPC12/RpoP